MAKTKSTMTPKKAAQVWKRVKAAKEKLTPLETEARGVLLEKFAADGIDKFEGIQLAIDTRNQLDTTRVKNFLGDRLPEFQKPVTSRTLSLIEEP